MSMELMVKAMNVTVGNPLRKLVLIKLADNANDKGECWPSYQHIADQCEISRRSVMNHVEALIESGFLRKVTRKGPKGNASNVYILTIAAGEYAAPDGAGDSLGVVQEIHQGSETGSPDGAGDSPGGSAGDSPRTSHSFEPVIEPVIEPSDARANSDSDLPPISTTKRFAMHDGWQPTTKGWIATAKRNGLDTELLNAESLGEFRSYWINRPDKHQSQGQWEHSLAQTIKRIHARSNGHDRPTEGSSARQQRDSNRPRSAVDRVKQAIAERQAREAAAAATGQALDEDDRDVRPPLDGECWRVG